MRKESWQSEKNPGRPDDVDSDYGASSYQNSSYSKTEPIPATLEQEQQQTPSQQQCEDDVVTAATSNTISVTIADVEAKRVVTADTQRKPSTRVQRLLQRLSVSVLRRRRVSDDSSSVLSVASVARPDFLRSRLRAVIMFVLIANVCLWMFQSLDGTAFQIHSFESEFFGASSWTIVQMICRPLYIFFRMHSAGCLFEMWSYA